MNAPDPTDVNIGWGKGLVLSGSEPLPEPLFTKISDTILHS